MISKKVSESVAVSIADNSIIGGSGKANFLLVAIPDNCGFFRVSQE